MYASKEVDSRSLYLARACTNDGFKGAVSASLLDMNLNTHPASNTKRLGFSIISIRWVILLAAKCTIIAKLQSSS